MILKLNASKIGGSILAVLIMVALSTLFTLRSNDPIAELTNSDKPNMISANNINMSLISAHIEGGYGYRVELCYSLPDQRDWLLTYPNMPLNTILSVADTEARPVEEGTMYWKHDENGMIAQRCQYLYFAIGIPAQAQSLSLTIQTLYAREPGQSDFCLETSQKMAERNSKIEIDCMKIDGFERLVYVKFPVELLSMDPVYKSIFKDVKWNTYPGPWSFTFPVNPQ